MKKITAHQKWYLKKRGYDPEELSAYDAWLVIGKLKALEAKTNPVRANASYMIERERKVKQNQERINRARLKMGWQP